MILITQVFFLTKIRIFIIKLANFYFGEEKREREKKKSYQAHHLLDFLLISSYLTLLYSL